MKRNWFSLEKPLYRPGTMLSTNPYKSMARGIRFDVGVSFTRHRVAISNGRLLSCEQGRVTFRWRDSKDNNRPKVMSLDAVEFIRRFLIHILPPGFVKIRHFGFLANRKRSVQLYLCRKLLNAPAPAEPAPGILTDRQTQTAERRCPECRTGILRIVGRISSDDLLIIRRNVPVICQIDSS
jgi:hypothetical protein